MVPGRSRSVDLAAAGSGIRGRLERRGPLAVKIGQYLAGRVDVVPQEHIDELLLLVDLDAPEPWPQVQATITADLARPIGEAFDWINPTPETSGALTQVHVARTADGDPVSVKVLRPGAAEAVRPSSASDKLLRGVLDDCGVEPAARPSIERAVRTWLLDEVDLERECRNAPRLSRADVRGQRFRFPIARPDLSSGRVFTSSHLRGVRFSDLLPLISHATRDVHVLGFDSTALADDLVEGVLQQVFALGPFPALPHPSSLVALPDGEIGFLDVSFIGRVDTSERDRQLAIVAALPTGDADRVVSAASAMLATSDHRAMERFRDELADGVRRIHRDAEVTGDSGPALGVLLREIVSSAHRHGLGSGSDALVAHRALLTADAVAKQLDPTSGLQQVADRFFLRLQVRTVVGQASLDNVQGVALDVLDLLTSAPGQVGRLLSELAEDRFVLRVATSESDADRRSGHARARLVSLAIVLVALATLVTAPGLDGAVVVRAVLGVVLAAAAAVFALLWARLR